MAPAVFVHIVTYHSNFHALCRAIESVLAQEHLGALHVRVTDNGGDVQLRDQLTVKFAERISFISNSSNLGFCGAHNQGAAIFLQGAFDYLLILNPDLRLERNAVAELIGGIEEHSAVGAATPLLLRADSNLDPLDPPSVDAAGMIFTPDLRHLDRGAGGPVTALLLEKSLVFGGTGACLLLSRACVAAGLLEAPTRERDVDRIFPQLAAGRNERAQLFDEAFFAYREDADLAWRLQILGWGCVYVPTAIGYHERRVIPERRASLPAELNLHSVRNRYLMQLNNLTWPVVPHVLRGLIVRNTLVLLAVLFRERTSLPAFRQGIALFRRARERHKTLIARARKNALPLGTQRKIVGWFTDLDDMTAAAQSSIKAQ